MTLLKFNHAVTVHSRQYARAGLRGHRRRIGINTQTLYKTKEPVVDQKIRSDCATMNDLHCLDCCIIHMSRCIVCRAARSDRVFNGPEPRNSRP